MSEETLNTSNITVPKIATMREHLAHANPHPQYMMQSNLVSSIKGNVLIGDLNDVTLTAGMPSKSLLVYDGVGTWSNIEVSVLMAELAVPDATEATKGIAKITEKAYIDDATDSRTIVTPYTLNEWKNKLSVVTTSNFRANFSSTFASGGKFPVAVQNLENVTVTDGEDGQALVLKDWDPVLNTGVVVNSRITPPKASSEQYGLVRVATPSQVLSGGFSSYEQMESSGHLVPSLAYVKTLVGHDKYVSRISTNNSSSVYENISGAGTEGEGVTDNGYITVIHQNGVVQSHVVGDNGTLKVQGGILLGVTVSSGGTIDATSGDICNAVLYSGAYMSASGHFNVDRLRISGGNAFVREAVVHDVDITSAGRLSAASVEHATLSSSGYLKTTDFCHHATLTGDSTQMEFTGYADDVVISSGAMLTVSGTAQNISVMSGATLKVLGKAYGVTKYPGAVISSGAGAVIVYNTLRQDDILVFSSVDSGNINNGIISFTAIEHPVGLRKVTSSGSTYIHKFYPMAVDTRIPNSADASANDYTIDASGLSVWSDISEGKAGVQWYVVF